MSELKTSRDTQAFQRDLKRLCAATGWSVDSIAADEQGLGWRFVLDEPSVESTMPLSVNGFGYGYGRVHFIEAWQPVTRISMVELIGRHDQFIAEDFAEILSNDDLTFIVCGICKTVRQQRLRCQDDDYCAGCAAEHYLNCLPCLRGEGEPDERSFD
jgi:hypothetical protein